MADINDVIEGLEYCVNVYPMCGDKCPYSHKCMDFPRQIQKDALELLKDYRQHLQNDLETLKEEKRKLELEHEAKAFIYPQPHPCKECDKYGCDVHCPYYGK